MAERLLSVGLDVGTTSTQMVLSELNIENKAGSFSVPEMEISERNIIYKSPVHFTPLKGQDLVDAEKLREIIAEEYANAGIDRKSVDTGAIIITGETSRKENARAVLEQLSDFAGDFVVATAGPDLESVLAAKGAGADLYSEKTGKTVLHMDIGGGTSNLAFIRDGKIIKTGCLNVGGRLLKFDERGVVAYVSPVLRGICDIREGDAITEQKARDVAKILVSALEMAAAKRETTELFRHLTTEGTDMPPEKADVISFSGGVADCIEVDIPWMKYGDIGPVLGREIRNSLLCKGEYALGAETIRATVIGAGCHSAQLSGSTVFYRNITFPLKNVPAVRFDDEAEMHEGAVFWTVDGDFEPDYSGVVTLADEVIKRVKSGPIYV
ncbi:MAG: ethanolamine ammonia-lyase reactivating factor EutA, partial [Oscillospiraceae bacterium]|nr:ethanolamine ammonia-lyase reactivating factor EutA [Oscillospiraceae bacterium]